MPKCLIRHLSFGVALLISGCSTTNIGSGPSRETSSQSAVALPAAVNDDMSADTPDDPRDLRGVVQPADVLPSSPTFFGLLHAHTSFSDGSGTPREAYARAKRKDVDFFAVTPHNHKAAESGAKERRDGVLIATSPALYNAELSVTFDRQLANGTTREVTADSVISAAKLESDDRFVGIYGQEFSTISSGNHINVLWWDEVLTVANGEFEDLYAAFDKAVARGERAPILQLNHPSVRADLFRAGTKESEKSNDYGFDDFDEDFAALVAAADKYIHLIEVLSGPAMIEESLDEYSYGSKDREADYYFYLSQGFHISPSVGHDNHYKTWGDATPARMGVLARALSDTDIYDALRRNRTYATEDSDLRVQLFANGEPMGSTLTIPSGGTIRFEVVVSDPTDRDIEYEAVLTHGLVSPENAETLKWVSARDGVVDCVLLDGPTASFTDQYASGDPEFFYVRVQQQGDGDRAWTAPVWVNHPRTDAN